MAVVFDEEAPSSGKVVFDEEGPSMGGLAKNAISNAGRMLNPINMVKGLGDQVKAGAYDLPKETTETIAQGVGSLVSGEPMGETPMAKRASDIAGSEAVQDPVKYAYENPVDAAATVAMPAMAFMPEAAGAIAPKEQPTITPPTQSAPPIPEKIEPIPMRTGPEKIGEPASRIPPSPNEPPTAPQGKPASPDPLKDVRDYIGSKYQKVQAKGGWPEKIATYLKEESNKLGAKDIGLQGRQIQTMGQGFKGLEKANSLIDYARENGYLEPSLTDAARRAKISSAMESSGRSLDAVRNIADQRGAPPLDTIKAQVKQELAAKYGSGVEKATSEINNVMDDIEKAKPTFSGMSELATKLNASATKIKDLGQHPGPTTDAANIVSRINNDAIRAVLNDKEGDLYTKSLREYGANKKLEQATAGAGRREMAARSNQRGVLGRLWQETLDRGGYRIGGNIANKVSNTILRNPGKIRTLPQFFEELAHQSNDTLDEALGIDKMAHGGIVPNNEVNDFVSRRYGKSN